MRFLRSIHVAVVVLLLTIVVSFYVDGRNDQMHRQHLEVSTRLERMLRLNQQLTSMLTIAVLEQNPLRASTYDTVNAELNRTIREVSAQTQGLALSSEVAALNEHQTELRQIEQQAIALVRADAWAAARQLLFDDRYLMGKRPPNALLARGWIQVQAVVGTAGCQRWGSREEMSACLVVGRRVMTSRRYA